jgi:cytochrome c oxidase subunit III
LTAYGVARYRAFDAFLYGSERLNLTLGTINTAVLLTSSLTMALAVYAAQTGRRTLLTWLALTLLLGGAFLGIKAVEWYQDYTEGLVPSIRWDPALWQEGHESSASPGGAASVNPHEVEMFFVAYFCLTGLHALHMLIGAGILIFLMVQAARHRYSPRYFTPVEVAGLYWHFVDIVWIFLFPLLYLIRH